MVLIYDKRNKQNGGQTMKPEIGKKYRVRNDVTCDDSSHTDLPLNIIVLDHINHLLYVNVIGKKYPQHLSYLDFMSFYEEVIQKRQFVYQPTFNDLDFGTKFEYASKQYMKIDGVPETKLYNSISLVNFKLTIFSPDAIVKLI